QVRTVSDETLGDQVSELIATNNVPRGRLLMYALIRNGAIDYARASARVFGHGGQVGPIEQIGAALKSMYGRVGEAKRLAIILPRAESRRAVGYVEHALLVIKFVERVLALIREAEPGQTAASKDDLIRKEMAQWFGAVAAPEYSCASEAGKRLVAQ